jgi:hypothetical protein
VEIKIVHPTDDRLAEIADLPLVVDKGQRGMKWTKYLHKKKMVVFGSSTGLMAQYRKRTLPLVFGVVF